MTSEADSEELYGRYRGNGVLSIAMLAPNSVSTVTFCEAPTGGEASRGMIMAMGEHEGNTLEALFAFSISSFEY